MTDTVETSPRPIVVAGATGMIGAATVPLLLARGHRVAVLTRRPTGLAAHPGLTEVIADPADWSDRIAALRPATAISALGTTMAQAGGEAAFRAVDHDLVLSVARAAREAGARHMLSVSAVGADPDSRTFYLRVKGEVEAALSTMGFDRVDLMQPGQLLGDRGGPLRLGERFAMAISPLTNALTPARYERFRAIPATMVARALAALTDARDPGVFRHTYGALTTRAAD